MGWLFSSPDLCTIWWGLSKGVARECCNPEMRKVSPYLRKISRCVSVEIKISTSQADFFCAQLWLQVNIPRVKSACQIPKWSRKKVSEPSTYCSPKPLRWKWLVLLSQPDGKTARYVRLSLPRPQLLDDLISWHRYGLNFSIIKKLEKIMFGSFYRPEEPLHQEVHSGSQIPALAEFNVKFDVVQ